MRRIELLRSARIATCSRAQRRAAALSSPGPPPSSSSTPPGRSMGRSRALGPPMGRSYRRGAGTGMPDSGSTGIAGPRCPGRRSRQRSCSRLGAPSRIQRTLTDESPGPPLSLPTGVGSPGANLPTWSRSQRSASSPPSQRSPRTAPSARAGVPPTASVCVSGLATIDCRDARRSSGPRGSDAPSDRLDSCARPVGCAVPAPAAAAPVSDPMPAKPGGHTGADGPSNQPPRG